MLETPIRVHIRVTKRNPVLAEMPDGKKTKTPVSHALQMVEEVKKVHLNAEIHVEVEV